MSPRPRATAFAVMVVLLVAAALGSTAYSLRQGRELRAQMRGRVERLQQVRALAAGKMNRELDRPNQQRLMAAVTGRDPLGERGQFLARRPSEGIESVDGGHHRRKHRNAEPYPSERPVHAIARKPQPRKRQARRSPARSGTSGSSAR